MSEITPNPCPFCGFVKVDLFHSFGDADTNQNYVHVGCISCGAQGASAVGEKQAAALWNKRANTASAGYAEMLAIIKSIAESDNYPHYKEIRERARNFIQRKRL